MRFLDRFRRDETGALTIEYVLWVPIILGLLLLVVDVTTMYVTHSEMTNVARDTVRRMVTGVVLTEEDAEAYAVDAMRMRDHHTYYIDAHYDMTTGAEVIIGFSLADVSIFGYATPLRIFGGKMATRVVMRPDPNVEFGTASSGSGPGKSPSS